jgi:hypothetical protein
MAIVAARHLTNGHVNSGGEKVCSPSIWAGVQPGELLRQLALLRSIRS